MPKQFSKIKLFFTIAFALQMLVSCSEPYKYLSDKNATDETLLKNIIPAKTITHWQLEYVPGFKDDKTPYDIVFQKGNIGADEIPNEPEKRIDMEGFLSGCMPGYCAYRIRYVEHGQWKLLINEDELKEFIGAIDNEYEAFLIARLKDFSIDNSHEGNGFLKADDGYFLKVMKYKSCPESKEEFKLFVSKDGSLERIKSLGYYMNSKDCIMY